MKIFFGDSVSGVFDGVSGDVDEAGVDSGGAGENDTEDGAVVFTFLKYCPFALPGEGAVNSLK